MIEWEKAAGGIEYGKVHGVIVFTLHRPTQSYNGVTLYDWNDERVTSFVAGFRPPHSRGQDTTRRIGRRVEAEAVANAKKKAQSLFDEHFGEDLKNRLMQLLLPNEAFIEQIDDFYKMSADRYQDALRIRAKRART